MSIEEYISQAPAERQELLTAIHEVIIANDPNIVAAVKPMMGKDMILYEQKCYMKYGLADTKKYMSLHCVPMYMNALLYAKFTALMPDAQFQKGCVNFNSAAEMPLAAVTVMITDCAQVNLAEVLENRKKKAKK